MKPVVDLNFVGIAIALEDDPKTQTSSSTLVADVDLVCDGKATLFVTFCRVSFRALVADSIVRSKDERSLFRRISGF